MIYYDYYLGLFTITHFSQTLLYCDDNGQFYQIKARHYKRPQYKKEHQRDKLPDKESQGHSTDGANSQPAKYTTPQHVHQLTPDYRMLSFSKPKRRRRRQDDSIVWFCGIGSTSSKRKHKGKKKKKKQVGVAFCLAFDTFKYDLSLKQPALNLVSQ